MFSTRVTIHIALACAIVAGTARPARAQIYSWRDADGRLVLSNIRPADQTSTDLKSSVAPASDDIRTARETSPIRSGAYDDLIARHSRLNDIRPSLVRAVIQVESGFNPSAVSEKGAMGLMQLMPATARELGVKNAFDPAENVEAGVAYLRRLLDRYDNNEQLALAAYNAGPGAVDKYGQAVPPYRETRDYVLKVNGLAKPAAKLPPMLYKTIEIIDGRPVIKYSDRQP